MKNGKLVILRRKNNVWLMPKGHVEPGETLEEAASREVLEETGLQVRIGPPLGKTEYSYKENDTFHRKKVYWFYMEAIGGEIRPEEEMFTEVKLLLEDELDTLTFPGDQRLAEKAFSMYKAKTEYKD